MALIKDIKAIEIIDSRGEPTIEAYVYLDDNTFGKFSIPSGASTGVHEALELRDGDPKRFYGKGVLKAVENINYDIKSFLLGIDPRKQLEIDKAMIDYDGTEDKSKLGANAMLAVSGACARAAANSAGRELYQYLRSEFLQDGQGQSNELKLPTPMFNILNGGAHADNNISFQEFMVVPVGIAKYSEKLRAGVEIHHQLKKVLKDRGATTAVGDEGGFAPELPSIEVAMDLLVDAIRRSGYREGSDIKISIDVAISQFWDEADKLYTVPAIQGEKVFVGNAEKLSRFYLDLIGSYPILSVEDPFHEDRWDDWKTFKQLISEDHRNVLVVGDDLTTTKTERLTKALDMDCINAVIIKPNQIGTLSEVFDVYRVCKSRNISMIVSNRSGETPDTFIADLAVALGAEFIKDGAPVRGERTAKYNRLLEIEHKLSE
ncbi:phosphopyruvate hydratase [Candidatus Dojkabacteria bacterium]|uniref:Enolase n=1 Tax=Candidatus Dojkabacteria bacterium TaxID=2099670 RepID=A0A955RI34_9BACT|nr:phosphopyruvate hydratase [Candidatus Dojkabacteria bacterium]